MQESNRRSIEHVAPTAGVEGGEVIVTCEGYDTSRSGDCRVFFGDWQGRLVSASPTRVVAAIPETPKGAGADNLRLVDRQGAISAPFTLGRKLAENLHPVANPAIDRDDGSIYVTLSGTRGQRVPVSIFKISPDESVTPFVSDIVNPTGLAFNRHGELLVTSRYEGILYRVSPFREVETIATDLGVATGIAINQRDEIFVGDRSGTIMRINEIGEARPFASLEPSVSAYHLAFSPDGDLYVTGPTVSSFESVVRVDPMGRVSRFYTGLGRPQGLTFDQEGNLYVAASLHGHRGIVRISPDGRQAEVVVAGSSLVGLAFDDRGNMIVVSTERVYSLKSGE